MFHSLRCITLDWFDNQVYYGTSLYIPQTLARMCRKHFATWAYEVVFCVATDPPYGLLPYPRSVFSCKVPIRFRNEATPIMDNRPVVTSAKNSFRVTSLSNMFCTTVCIGYLICVMFYVKYTISIKPSSNRKFALYRISCSMVLYHKQEGNNHHVFNHITHVCN